MIGPALEGVTVRLRGWREADLPVLSILRSDVDLQAKLMARARPNPIERVREWLVERAAQPDLLLYVIASRADDSMLGYVQAAAMDVFQGHCELGICLSPLAQGHGIATAALDLLHTHLGDQYGLRKIGLRVRADNARAIAFYRREGYLEVGRLAGHYRERDAYIDIILMERLLRRAAIRPISPT
ncbi:GNAT family N-acetyltransferase [Solilutibacter silvestris]|uniref:Acetyltransferase (GNAT) domain n=1 Tax=Solilutibacter silvestris TaxID=1645665 RepID=A0A2K1Q2P1_9GAMM|nr:GNAT family protein [Lysobacter silvestris]PNS09303.1 Acetyltransferase (GNAT) domain [Lysobacter silvestris]